jgi:hypothetical protein
MSSSVGGRKFSKRSRVSMDTEVSAFEFLGFGCKQLPNSAALLSHLWIGDPPHTHSHKLACHGFAPIETD